MATEARVLESGATGPENTGVNFGGLEDITQREARPGDDYIRTPLRGRGGSYVIVDHQNVPLKTAETMAAHGVEADLVARLEIGASYDYKNLLYFKFTPEAIANGAFTRLAAITNLEFPPNIGSEAVILEDVPTPDSRPRGWALSRGSRIAIGNSEKSNSHIPFPSTIVGQHATLIYNSEGGLVVDSHVSHHHGVIVVEGKKAEQPNLQLVKDANRDREVSAELRLGSLAELPFAEFLPLQTNLTLNKEELEGLDTVSAEIQFGSPEQPYTLSFVTPFTLPERRPNPYKTLVGALVDINRTTDGVKSDYNDGFARLFDGRDIEVSQASFAQMFDLPAGVEIPSGRLTVTADGDLTFELDWDKHYAPPADIVARVVRGQPGPNANFRQHTIIEKAPPEHLAKVLGANALNGSGGV